MYLSNGSRKDYRNSLYQLLRKIAIPDLMNLPIKTALVDPWKSAVARAVGILLNLLSNFTQSTE
jgi:hypothetical protein